MQLCKKNRDFFLIIQDHRFSNNLLTCDFSGGEVSKLTTTSAIIESGSE
jgi:hypothetical protein